MFEDITFVTMENMEKTKNIESNSKNMLRIVKKYKFVETPIFFMFYNSVKIGILYFRYTSPQH